MSTENQQKTQEIENTEKPKVEETISVTEDDQATTEEKTSEEPRLWLIFLPPV